MCNPSLKSREFRIGRSRWGDEITTPEQNSTFSLCSYGSGREDGLSSVGRRRQVPLL